MAKVLGLPKLSPTMEEGTLVRWAKKEGDAVNIDDLLAEVETDKATMEFRAFDKGVLLKILAEEGATLAPDQPVAILGNQGEDISSMLTNLGNAQKSDAPETKRANAQPKEAAQRSKDTKAQEAADDETKVTGQDRPQAQETALSQGAHGRVLASPLVRKVAREKSIDLKRVQGSGPGGRIIKRDLDGVQQMPSQVSKAAAADRDVPLSSMRKTIARRLTESKQTIPHFYLTIDVNVDALWQAREQINAQLKDTGEKISLNDLIIKATALALRKVPEANASFLGDKIRYHGRVDISVAVAIPDGLVTPVVRNADTKGVLAIAQEVRALAERAKQKKLQPEEMSGGTFSISNLGMYGIEEFSAVINPPEGAILAVGTAREEAVIVGGQIGKGRRMRMTLSCDHRVIDGAVGASFLKALRANLESPLSMLL